MRYLRLWIIVLSVLACVLMTALIGCGIRTVNSTVRIALADEQTGVFEEMQLKAIGADPTQAVGYLEYTVRYYPSGTKQVTGSPLDRVVERARKATVRVIIHYLRAKTGEDFGDDPEIWIRNLKKWGE